MAANLIEGLSLELSHPELPTCDDCQKWIYGSDWRRTERGRPPKPQERPKGTPLPCINCPKSRVHNTPRPDRELTNENRAALAYYHLCQADATGLIPRDLIVVQNNALIGRAIDQWNRGKEDLTPILLAMFAGSKKR